ncbi:hypothetical protein SAMN05216312_10862 [Cohnella sp. OV330]|uniref:hypothetical protein n=1 Tax=Cohnella sp. OV330 TaxID=1855288 RepID=UPI0008F43C34|nr:hypothetical protein [Cohnella sp. OV330]SFB43621.1 hypothetical protein SAMN05216312_10862 [Cohnella sp. OV330]
MRTLLEVFGYLIMVGGTSVGLTSGSVTLIAFSIFGGPVLLGLSHLIGIAENVQARMLDLPPTLATVRSVIKGAPEYVVESPDLDIYPSADTKYEWIDLNGDVYMRSRAFRKYIENVENRFAFTLPGRETVVLHNAGTYSNGEALFSLDGYSYVMLSAIGLAAVREHGRIVLQKLQAFEDADES